MERTEPVLPTATAFIAILSYYQFEELAYSGAPKKRK